MIYLLIGTNLITIVLAVALVVALRRDLRTAGERAHTREDALLNRIQAPELAVTQSQPEPSEEPLHVPADDSPHADNVWDLFVEESD